jgi:hypothetical protein
VETNVRWLVLVLALTATPLLGDELFLKGGGRVTGEIVKETEAAVTVDIGAGNMTVQKSAVVRVERSVSPLQKYRAQAASLAPEDVEGWRKLGSWAAGQGLTRQAREAFTKVKDIVPDDPEANRALGLVLLDGRWVTEKESFTARGFVLFEDEWMMPAERDAITEERRAREAADRQALDAEIEADQAEQAAQEAREDAENNIWTGPLDNIQPWNNGYGYGPTFWPAQPGNLPGSALPAWEQE